jgi:hypothetical protein
MAKIITKSIRKIKRAQEKSEIEVRNGDTYPWRGLLADKSGNAALQ